MYTTKQIAKACHLSEAAIRQWLCRAPEFAIGHLAGHVRTYSADEALTLAVAAEILRHSLGRPHEVLPIAQRLASSPTTSAWVHRPRGHEIVISAGEPNHTAIHIPVSLLRERLTGSKKGANLG